MNEAEVELLLHRILCGSLYFYFQQEKYELRSCSNTVRYEADLLYDKIINDEKYNDWIREENMIYTMINLGLWHKQTDSFIKQLNNKIDNYKVELFQNFATTSKHPKIRKNLDNTRYELNKILNTKQDFFNNTLEGYAMSIKNEHIICNSLYKNNKRVLQSDSSNANTYSFFNSLIMEINKYSISINKLKNVAKSQVWKSYWNASKENVFPGTVSEWTDDQRGLVNLSKMYDSVYEHPDCPNDKVIEDDDMLDGWMIVQKKKNEKQKTQKTIDDMNPNLKNAQEVFLMASNTEEVDNIIGLNSEQSLYRMKEKIAAINQAGSIDDSMLPDTQRQIMNQANEMRKNR